MPNKDISHLIPNNSAPIQKRASDKKEAAAEFSRNVAERLDAIEARLDALEKPKAKAKGKPKAKPKADAKPEEVPAVKDGAASQE